MRLRGRHVAALLVTAFVVTASTCKEVTVKVIDAQPESELVYPGGQVAWGDSLAPYGFSSGKRTYIVGAPAAMAAGATGILFTRWRPLLDGPLFGAFGPMGMDGSATPRAEMASKLARWTNAHPEIWKSRQAKGDVGILFVQ